VHYAQAHARLLARHVVELQDAVVAVIITESSQHGSPVLGFSNAMYTKFVDDPDAEYDEQECAVLASLGLSHLRRDPGDVPSGAGTAFTDAHCLEDQFT
jgi:hypothetical protein